MFDPKSFFVSLVLSVSSLLYADPARDVRWKGFAVEYETESGTWAIAPRYFIAEAAGSRSNPDGTTVEFAKGDLVLEIPGLGAYATPAPARTAPLIVPNPEHVSMTATEVEVVHLTNAHRARNGRRPLKVGKARMASARNWSVQMKNRYGFQHMPGAAENIGWNYRSAAAAVTGWIHSPGHNRNLLAGYTEIGIGHTHPYWSQQFR